MAGNQSSTNWECISNDHANFLCRIPYSYQLPQSRVITAQAVTHRCCGDLYSVDYYLNDPELGQLVHTGILIHSYIPDICMAPLEVHYYSEELPAKAVMLGRS